MNFIEIGEKGGKNLIKEIGKCMNNARGFPDRMYGKFYTMDMVYFNETRYTYIPMS